MPDAFQMGLKPLSSIRDVAVCTGVVKDRMKIHHGKTRAGAQHLLGTCVAALAT
jgi:hypothetical protein